MTADIARSINRDLNISVSRIAATIGLLDSGATVPFIARYRKEATGNIDEVQIREIAERYAFHREFEHRREFILTKLHNKGVLTDALRSKIEGTQVRNELEDLYLPYRPKRQSRAGAARSRGLEELANYLQEQSGTQSAEERADAFVSEERDVPTREAALNGALDIIAERIAEDADLRKWLRDFMLSEGVIRARALAGSAAPKTRYSTYYDFTEPVARIPSHRVLAIRRGAKEKILSFSVEFDQARAREETRRRLGIAPTCPWARLLERSADDAFGRLLEPSIQNEVRSLLKARAETEAIRVFEENLRALLLAPPAGQISVLGIDPGMRSGSKLAAVDPTGRLVGTETIFLSEPKRDLDRAKHVLLDLIDKFGIRGIAIGNGTGSRETEAFVRSVVVEQGEGVFIVVVSEAGASVYSASPGAREEFPDLDVSVRGAVSIARRLQDPLSELVKVDPKSIGVGQYQHDVNQNRLQASLKTAVESSVNRVGVELNTASIDLLRYVSGIEESVAEAIVKYRNTHGAFSNRQQLREVTGLGEKTFEQAAGFLRIEHGTSPLDQTSVHPESYAAVERLAASIDVSVDELIGEPSRLGAIRFQDFEQTIGRFTLADIQAELEKPGRDPRRRFVVPRFRDDVRNISDLREGMELDGQVTNVTNFGAFVDVGVHQDGLVHISELSHRYVPDARHAIGVGDMIRVRVVGVDVDANRISLSRKALLPKPQIRPKPKPSVGPREKPQAVDAGRGTGRDRKSRPRTKRQASRAPSRSQTNASKPQPETPTEPEVSMEEKIRRLREKFRGPERTNR